MIRDTLPARRVGSAVGAVAAISSVGGAIGILVTGPIITTLGVPWLFWLPAIANGVVGFGVLTVVPRSVPHAEARVNWQAGVALAATLALLLLPLSLGGDWGWGSPVTIVLFAAAVAMGVLWVFIETHSDSPLIDMAVFRLRPVWTANLTSLLFGVTLYSAFGFIPAFLQVPPGTGYGLGESVTTAGLLFLPMTVSQFAGGLAAGPLAARMPPKVLLVLGALPVVAGFVVLAFAHSEVWQVVLATAVTGAGFGISLSALSAVVVHAVPHRHTGVSTGMNANIRTIGGALGAAVIATVLSAHSSGGFPSETGYTTAFAILAVVGLLGLASCLLIPEHTRKER
nr:MFS transporter [Saccharopolyspora soli]